MLALSRNFCKTKPGSLNAIKPSQLAAFSMFGKFNKNNTVSNYLKMPDPIKYPKLNKACEFLIIPFAVGDMKRSLRAKYNLWDFYDNRGILFNIFIGVALSPVAGYIFACIIAYEKFRLFLCVVLPFSLYYKVKIIEKDNFIKSLVKTYDKMGLKQAQLLSVISSDDRAKEFETVEREIVLFSYTGYRYTGKYVDVFFSSYADLENHFTEPRQSKRKNPMRESMVKLLDRGVKVTLIVLSEDAIDFLSDKLFENPRMARDNKMKMKMQRKSSVCTVIDLKYTYGDLIDIKQIASVPRYVGEKLDDNVLFIQIPLSDGSDDVLVKLERPFSPLAELISSSYQEVETSTPVLKCQFFAPPPTMLSPKTMNTLSTPDADLAPEVDVVKAKIKP